MSNKPVMLFLDDNREPIDVYRRNIKDYYRTIGIVRSFEEFKTWITQCYTFSGMLPEVISFDYVLNETTNSHNTGADCALLLVDFCKEHNLNLPECKVHSAHVGGILKIAKVLNTTLAADNRENVEIIGFSF